MRYRLFYLKKLLNLLVCSIWLGLAAPGALADGYQAAYSDSMLLPGLAMTFCLSFVQAFSVFPSAVMVGEPADATRVISVVAYHAAFEEYDYSMASAIAMLMGVVQLGVVVLVLSLRSLLYRGPAGGGKG